MELISPSDDGFDAARQAWNLAVDQRPAAVGYAESAGDVAAAVAHARDSGLRVAVQGTGHGASPMGDLGDTLLLKTARMAGFELDAEARRVRAEAGALWGDVVERTAEHGLVSLHGSSPDVGVVGYTLGGGIGWLTRSHGLASNAVTAAEVVTADGRTLRVDADTEPDLFWALRGGGGSFAAVTALEFELFPLTEAYAGWLVWEAADCAAVVNAFREWTAGAPREITTSLRLLHLPPLPIVPEPLRDRPIVVFDGAFQGSREDGEALLQPLRESAPLVMDTWDVVPAAQLGRIHGDPEQPVPGIGDGFMLGELSEEAADAFIAAGGPDSGSPLLQLELRHLGGAAAEAPEGAGALDSLPGAFTLYGVGLPMGPGRAEAILAHLDRVRELLDPWNAGSYLNLAEGARTEVARGFGAETYERLRGIKSAYDPDDVFRANHQIAPL